MTAILITPTEVMVDCRASRGGYIDDNHKKFIQFKDNPNIYFIAGSAQKAKDALWFIHSGKWASPEAKEYFVKHDAEIMLVELNPEGFIRFLELSFDEEKNEFITSLAGDVYESKKEGNQEYLELGSGGPALFGAYFACGGDTDAAFKALSLLKKCCSSNYYRVCRTTQKIKYCKGL